MGGRNGGMKSEEYAINHRIYTTRMIAADCHCSVTTVYNHWSTTKGTDQEKFDSLKRKMQDKSFRVGFTSLQTVSQITHYDKTLIYNFLRTESGNKYETETLKHGENNQPQLMIRSCDLMDFVTDIREYRKSVEEKAEKKAVKEKAKKKAKLSLEELKKLHPLVTDERCFEESWFPNIDSYFILSECNYHRPEGK